MEAKSLVVELEPGALLSLADSRGARVRCMEGALWITQERDRNDVVLERGSAFEVARNGRTVVQALAPARVAVDTPSEAGWSGRARRLPAPSRQAAPA